MMIIMIEINPALALAWPKPRSERDKWGEH